MNWQRIQSAITGLELGNEQLAFLGGELRTAEGVEGIEGCISAVRRWETFWSFRVRGRLGVCFLPSHTDGDHPE